jgi:hypothetical protein
LGAADWGGKMRFSKENIIDILYILLCVGILTVFIIGVLYLLYLVYVLLHGATDAVSTFFDNGLKYYIEILWEGTK